MNPLVALNKLLGKKVEKRPLQTERSYEDTTDLQRLQVAPSPLSPSLVRTNRMVQPAARFDQTDLNQGQTAWNIETLARHYDQSVPGRFNGALPPRMINVAWSREQVPYGTPTPDWYLRQQMKQSNGFVDNF
jgi:hypothetical protein